MTHTSHMATTSSVYDNPVDLSSRHGNPQKVAQEIHYPGCYSLGPDLVKTKGIVEQGSVVFKTATSVYKFLRTGFSKYFSS